MSTPQLELQRQFCILSMDMEIPAKITATSFRNLLRMASGYMQLIKEDLDIAKVKEVK